MSWRLSSVPVSNIYGKGLPIADKMGKKLVCLLSTSSIRNSFAMCFKTRCGCC